VRSLLRVTCHQRLLLRAAGNEPRRQEAVRNPNRSQNHSLTVVARCEPRASSKRCPSRSERITPSRSWLDASRVRQASDVPIAPKITPSRSWLVASRVRQASDVPIAPKESLPHGRGSLRAARLSKRCPNRSQNHSLTVVARCEPRASSKRCPSRSQNHSLTVVARCEPRASSKRCPNRSQNHSLTVVARCEPRA